jgi:hypothetical protein
LVIIQAPYNRNFQILMDHYLVQAGWNKYFVYPQFFEIKNTHFALILTHLAGIAIVPPNWISSSTTENTKQYKKKYILQMRVIFEYIQYKTREYNCWWWLDDTFYLLFIYYQSPVNLQLMVRILCIIYKIIETWE